MLNIRPQKGSPWLLDNITALWLHPSFTKSKGVQTQTAVPKDTTHCCTFLSVPSTRCLPQPDTGNVVKTWQSSVCSHRLRQELRTATSKHLKAQRQDRFITLNIGPLFDTSASPLKPASSNWLSHTNTRLEQQVGGAIISLRLRIWHTELRNDGFK